MSDAQMPPKPPSKSGQMTEIVPLLREAATAMRTLATDAAKPENSHPYGDRMFPAATSPKAFGDMMREYLGGPWGEQAAAWHPGVALAVAAWVDDIAARHSPSAEPLDLYLHYDSDEECSACEGGGHSTTVCDGCFPQWDGMDGHSVYPCRETKAALTVARAFVQRSNLPEQHRDRP